MKMTISTSIFGALFLASSQVFAVGLGDINLESRLNQRFMASIPVLVSAETDADDLTVKLAGNEHFKRAGIKRDARVLALQFRAQRVGAEQMVIKVTSKKPVREPMMRFIVEIEHKGSRAMREYTTLLNAPDY